MTTHPAARLTAHCACVSSFVLRVSFVLRPSSFVIDVKALLEIKDLQIDFGRGPNALRAVDGVSLSLDAGETFCLVGESGSGKSVSALSIARLVPSPPAHYVGGQILLQG